MTDILILLSRVALLAAIAQPASASPPLPDDDELLSAPAAVVQPVLLTGVSVDRAWAHIAATLSRFRNGVYLADVYLLHQNRSLAMAAFGLMLSTFVRGRLHLHLRSEAHARDRLTGLGFSEVAVLAPHTLPGAQAAASVPGGDRVRILEALTTARPRRRQRPTSRRTRAR